MAAGHEELHIIAQQAHWFMNRRAGAASIFSKCLVVDLLILGLFFFVCRAFFFVDANPANVLHDNNSLIIYKYIYVRGFCV